MADVGKTFKLRADDAYPSSTRRHMLMSRTMKSDSLPVVGFCPGPACGASGMPGT